MTGGPVEPEAVLPTVEDVVPGLGERLQHLDQERARCLGYAATLSNWSMFWKLTIIVFGALVAAQGAFVKVWGSANWVTLAFIILGVLTAAGSGFDAVFKPGERSPKFARAGFAYERARRQVHNEANDLYRVLKRETTQEKIHFQREMDDILRRADDKLDELREKELSLYVTGPTRMGRRPRPAKPMTGISRRNPAASGGSVRRFRRR